jgi:hypothetical protein
LLPTCVVSTTVAPWTVAILAQSSDTRRFY